MRVVDLSIPLKEGANHVYEGARYLSIIPIVDYAHNHMLMSNNIEIWLHAGTHLDTPLHVYENGISLDKVPLDCVVREAVILDLSKTVVENQPISADMLGRAADHLLSSETTKIEEKDIIIIRTGWSEKYRPWMDEYRNTSPYLTIESADWLVNRKASAVGFDFPEEKLGRSLTQTKSNHAEHPLPVHRKLLGAGIYLIEHLTNLSELKKKRFLLIAAPLKIPGVEGSPIRALGIET